MSPTSFVAPTFFSVANRLFRDKRYEDAIGIYEILSEQSPEFLPYALNEKHARSELAKVGKADFKKKYHLQNATDYQKRLRMADVVSNLNDPALIKSCFDTEHTMPDAQHRLAQASATVATNYKQWNSFFNLYLAANKLAPVSLKPRDQWQGRSLFENLCVASLPSVDGPLVTVCMSCFNAERYVEIAVRSILNQSYRNFEMFVFNDCSADDTLAILRRLEKEDKRITVIDNKVNQGTYISRNQAFQRAKGEFFCIMDADDLALPERFALQVSHLQKNTAHMAVLTDWVRIADNGRPHFKNGWGGGYQHEAVATLMARTVDVRKRVGYWDSVRFAADSEFLFRLRKVFGAEAIPLLKTPTEISLFHEASLTNNPVTGINVSGRKGLSPTRLAYRNNWLQWHQQAVSKLFIPFPLECRLFDSPQEMLP